MLAIGVDAASHVLLDQLIRAGELPALGELRARSARCELRSGEGHRHGVLWTQFIYGLEASLDAEWLRLAFDPADYEAYQPNARHVVAGRRPFWESVPDLETVAFDVPRLAISDHGVQVTAWGAHAPLYPRASSPAGLLRDLDARFGPHPACANDYHGNWHDVRHLRRLTDALVEGARRRAEIACYLMDREPEWDLFLVAMSETHALSEFAWHSVDETHPLAHQPMALEAARDLRRVYRAVDDAVARMVDHAADATVMLFSLDGMRTSHGDLPSLVLLPELMHRDAYGCSLVRDPDQDAWRRAGMPPVVPKRGRIWRDHLDRALVRRPRPHGVGGVLSRVPGYERFRVSSAGRWALGIAKRARLGIFAVPIPPESERSAGEMEAESERVTPHLFIGHYRPHWPRMRAFALPTFGDGYFRINLKGREKHGIVEPGDFDAACRDVEELVRECRDVRTGRPVVASILRAPGDPFARTRYADLIAHWSGPIDAIEHPRLGMVGPFAFHRTGTHSDRGFLWMAGEGITSGELGERSMLDVAPTILTLLDRTPPADLAGAPIYADVSAVLPS